MTESHCGGCGRTLTDEEQLLYGWSCTECERIWQEEINRVESELTERL